MSKFTTIIIRNPRFKSCRVKIKDLFIIIIRAPSVYPHRPLDIMPAPGFVNEAYIAS